MLSKYSLTLSLVVLLLLVGGCDFLKTTPPGTLSKATFWKTEEDVRVFTNDLYAYLHGTRIFEWSALSDIATANKSFDGLVGYIRSEQNAESGYSAGLWSHSYRGIRRANELLANADKVQTDDPKRIELYKAEARFIRAYLYTYLAFWFGDVPLITKPISLDEAEDVTRAEQKKVWDFIASELQAASKILPVSYGSEDRGRITKGAALAMSARAMLYAGRYEAAMRSAKAVMDLGVYSLYSSYEDLFSYTAEYNQEVILNMDFVRDTHNNEVFNLLAPVSQLTGDLNDASRFVPTKKIVDAYEMKNGLPIDHPESGYDPRHPYENRDPRLGYSIFVYGDTLPNGLIYDPRPGFGGSDDIDKSFQTTETGFNIEKYVNPEDVAQPYNCGINIILIRYAEVLLTYAEAKIELGQIDASVYAVINQVRQRPDVDMPPIEPGKTQQELREIVRHERMVELAFEGQRFFDVRRWGIAEKVLNGPIYGMRYVDKDGTLKTVRFDVFERTFNPEDYLWPIPQKEVELMGLKQNPGY